MKKTLWLTIFFLVFASLPATADSRVRITVNNANVRSQPDLSGQVVLKAAAGDEFAVLATAGEWFKIALPAEADAPQGYVHNSVAELIDEKRPAAAPKPATEEPGRRARRTKPAPRPQPAKAAVQEKLFSGLAVKFGLRTKPPASFGDRWLLSLAWEKGLNPFLAAGLELQPYFRSSSDAGFSSSALGANLFLNAKGGVNMGRFSEKLKFLTPYAGAGLGGAFASYSSKFEGQKASGTQFNFAWHMMFGLEAAVKNLSAILEFQILKVSVADIDPDLTQYFWMLGVRF